MELRALEERTSLLGRGVLVQRDDVGASPREEAADCGDDPWAVPALHHEPAKIGEMPLAPSPLGQITRIHVLHEPDGIRSVHLGHPQGTALPVWEPGAHIDLWSREAHSAKFSLCSDPRDRDHWRIAVARVPDSTGASRFVHEELEVGSMVSVSRPANSFAMRPAGRCLFIAGGIGITPILPMAQRAADEGIDFILLHCGRTRAQMPFLEELAVFGDRAKLHVSCEGNRLDLPTAFAAAARDGAAIYCCGPIRLMDDAQRIAERHGTEVLTEHFTGVDVHADGDARFEIRLASSGKALTVPAGRSIVDVLRQNGGDVVTSCEAGNCGSCQTRVISGTPEHRDVYLTKGQRARNDRMMVCMSRCADGEPIVLDL